MYGLPTKHIFGPKGHGFSDVSSTPDPRIEQHVELVSHSINDIWQDSQRAHCPVDFAPAVIANHDALHPHCNAFLRILDGENAFQDDRAWPMLAQEGEILPVVAVIGEDCLRPFDGCALHVFLDFDAVILFELAPEDGIGEANRDADFVGAEEWVVSVRSSISGQQL